MYQHAPAVRGKKRGLNVTPITTKLPGRLICKRGRGINPNLQPQNIAERREASTEEESATSSTVPWSDDTNLDTSSYETIEVDYSSSTEQASTTSGGSEEETLRTGQIDELSSEDGISLSSICLTPIHPQICKTGREGDGLLTPTNKSIKVRSSMKKPRKQAKVSVEKLGKFKPKASSLLLEVDSGTDEDSSQSFHEKESHGKISKSKCSTPISGNNESLRSLPGVSHISCVSECCYHNTSAAAQRVQGKKLDVSCHGDSFHKEGNFSNVSTLTLRSSMQEEMKNLTGKLRKSRCSPCPIVTIDAPPPRRGVMIVKKQDAERLHKM